jgi:hypothetical protein
MALISARDILSMKRLLFEILSLICSYQAPFFTGSHPSSGNSDNDEFLIIPF